MPFIALVREKEGVKGELPTHLVKWDPRAKCLLTTSSFLQPHDYMGHLVFFCSQETAS